MADDNVSFTDNGTVGSDGKGAGGSSSAMLDLLGSMNKEEEKKEKKGKKTKKTKKKKTKTKMVRKKDKFESQNFLFRIEGSIFCAAIVIGALTIMTYIILVIVFSVQTNGNLVSYMHPWWGQTDEAGGEA